jgi:hypothetical protein
VAAAAKAKQTAAAEVLKKASAEAADEVKAAQKVVLDALKLTHGDASEEAKTKALEAVSDAFDEASKKIGLALDACVQELVNC